MPYSIVHRPVKSGKNYAKVNRRTGKVISRHRSKSKAKASVRAYYATRNQFVVNQNPLRVDPTRTTTIRGKFVADVKRRFKKLRQDVQEFMVGLDALGLKERKSFIRLQMPGPREFEFRTDAGKLAAFNEWLRQQIEADIFSVPPGTPVDQPWTAVYIDSAYRRGQVNAFLSSRQLEIFESGGVGGQTVQQFLITAFAQPEAISKIQLLATRTFENLRGVTATMSSQMNQILAQGIADGLGVIDIADQMTNRVDSLTRSRALTIARTEVIHAHAEGQLDSFERLGVKELGVKVEWSTAGDDRVCPLCQPLEGTIYTVKEARGLIPLHPNCVTGEMRILTPSPLSILKAKYNGLLFEVITTKGRRLSITQNHVLLSQRGWVFAKDLADSDYLIDTSFLNQKIGELPYDNLNIPKIGDCFSAISEMGRERFQSSSYPLSPEDFHYDGESFDAEINIVNINSHLWNHFQSFSLAKVEELLLMDGVDLSSLLTSQSRLSLLLLAAAAASDSFMGFLDASSLFLRGLPVGQKLISLGLGSQSNASHQESFFENSSIKSKLFLELKKGSPGVIELNSLIQNLSRDDNFGFGIGLTPGSDQPHFTKTDSKELLIASNYLSHLRTRQSASIEFNCSGYDKVQSISSRHVNSFPVFDVETMESIYILEGVLSSNCRCSWIPAI